MISATARTPNVEHLVTRSRAGDTAAFESLIPIVYEELRKIAHDHRSRWSGNETMGTTALVHEAYIKLADRTGAGYQGREHLLAVAARAMRQILVDYYRAKRTAKRGGNLGHLSFDRVDTAAQCFAADVTLSEEERLLELDDSLRRLAAESERHARIIECRYFAGLTIEETSTALGVSVATVKRGAAVARAFIARDLARRDTARSLPGRDEQV